MFARFFIDRPIFAWVLSLVIILIGLVSVHFLPIALYPEITPPTITVTASYPGANAQVVAETIAEPIEAQVNGVENMLYMSSQSTNDGSYTLTCTFAIGTDPNIAQVLVQNRVALAMPQLPAQVQLQGVNTKKKSPNILLAVNVISPDGRYDQLYLSNYATINIVDELSRLDGVGDVTQFGQRSYAMRIWVDPDELAARGLTAVDVVNAVRQQNVQVAAGAVGQMPVPRGQSLQLTMSALGRLESPKQFGDILLKAGTRNPDTPADASAPIVRVRDVARVEMGAQSYDQDSRLDGEPAAGMGIFPLPGANALDVGERIKAKMEELKRRFPPGLDYRILYDTTPFIRQSVDEVFYTLFIAVLLVAAVVLLFLQDWKAMILPMIDVPVSLIGTFAVMAAMGYTLNNLTLFGLVLAIGIVVDDAIVVLENIERLIATGLDARAATLQAMQEITGPIVAITLVLCAVFLPSTLVPGLTGQFYRQFAITISTAMVISALNAMTLTPSRAVSIFRTEEGGGEHEPHREALPWWFFAVLGGALTIWLAPRLGLGPPQAPSWKYWLGQSFAFLPGALLGGILGWFIIGTVNRLLAAFFGWFNRIFDRITNLYGRVIGRLLRLSAVVAVAYLALLVLTGWGLWRSPTGFIPEQDQGYLLVNVQLPDSASLQRTQEVMSRVDRIARDTPGVAHTVAVSGQSFLLGTNGSNLGSMFVVLAPFDERRSRDKYDETIAGKIQARCLKEVDDAVVGVFRSPPIRGLGNAGGFKLQVEQRGYIDLQQLQSQTDEFVAKANADPHFVGVFTQFRANVPQLFVDIDRAKATAMHVPIEDIFTTLQVYMGGLYVNQFNAFGRVWQVQVEAAPRFRTSPDPIKAFQVRGQQGQMVPLGTLARVRNSTGPLLIMRYNMYVSAPVNGVPAPGVSSGDVIRVVQRLADQAGISFEWTEMMFLQVQAGNVGMLIFALGTAFVYFVLAAKYESWRLPLAVILVVPLCILAAVTGMWIARLPIDIFVQIGLLVLIGLASKNAILIVEYAGQMRAEGKDPHEAARAASTIRFRPIIMTSLAFILGVLPLVIAQGAGAEMRRSLGTAVFAGMIGVTLFGILLTPTFYYVLERLAERRQARRADWPRAQSGHELRRSGTDANRPA
jgi:multidrug efflux pump